MGQSSTKDGDEYLAAMLLRKVLDAEVLKHDDNSQESMYDLDIVYRDGARGAAEVVSTRDAKELSLFAATLKIGYVKEPALTQFWWVQVSDDANIRRTRAAIVPLLVEFERQGLSRVPRYDFGELRDRLAAISVETCSSHAPTEKHPPGFYLWPGPKGAFVGDVERIVRESNEFLPTVPDVAHKLLISGASERHVVVIVTVERFDFFVTLEDGNAPTTPPELPDGIDNFWLLTMKSPPLQAVYWLGDGPWQRLTLTAGDLGTAVSEE